MSRHAGIVFRQRLCVGVDCRAIFYICCCCDRGHRYCGDRCRQKARRQQRCQANRKHQQSPDGKADHRDRQREYRKRRARKESVTDQSSPCRVPSGTIATATPIQAPQASRVGSSRLMSAIRWVVCIICGRRAVWIADVGER